LPLPDDLDALFPDSFQDSELGEIPAGWQVESIDDQFDLTMGQSPPGESYNQEGQGLPFYQGKTDFGFRYPTRRVYCTAPTRYAETGDTLVSVRAPVGAINMAVEHCSIGRGVAAIRHKSGSRSYTYYAMQFLSSVFGQFEAEGTVFGSISKKDFHNITIIRPPSELVACFEKLAFPFDQQIQGNDSQIGTLAAIRDTLLPKLLSGEIRVPEAEKVVSLSHAL
jgi:type I restriction enzyme S subunit